MESLKDYFVCDNCSNKDFSLIYNFALRFHGVNFSDDLIYDQLMDDLYQCTKCHRTFTRRQIEEGLAELKRKRKSASID